MIIDIEAIAQEMLKDDQLTLETLFNYEYAWSNSLIETLQDLYSLESQVFESVMKQLTSKGTK